ncbi:MAG: UDP-N-acetylglucosamine 4,6-dehydratase, partial [Vicinamibacteraceae bacterium]|nr:UDP-N-acetylglucosamine 4,6-dehydratase [Vicinamibacteraceae bacterium]
MSFDGARVLVTGGSGSLGQAIVGRLLAGAHGTPERVVVFSRDEAKQHELRLAYLHRRAATDEIIFRNFEQRLQFQIGDVRDYQAVVRAVDRADVVVHAAALKQVPTCEYFPYEAVLTNLQGTQNLVRAIRERSTPVRKLVAISSDKACKPISVMGMTKGIMERMLVEANLGGAQTTFLCARFGNVAVSRGSVVPLFLDQITHGGPVTVTHERMTRFLLSTDEAVDIVVAALDSGRPGETYVPRAQAVRVADLARLLVDGRDIPIVFTGVRPGEKMHEVLVSDEEAARTIERDGCFVILPMLPELATAAVATRALDGEYSSERVTADEAAMRRLLGMPRARP